MTRSEGSAAGGVLAHTCAVSSVHEIFTSNCVNFINWFDLREILNVCFHYNYNS